MEKTKDNPVQSEKEMKKRYFEQEVLKTLIIKGITVEKAGNGEALLTLKVSDDMYNVYGKIHGGVLFTLSDYAAGSCAYHLGKSVVTLNANINYIKAVTGDVVIAKAKAVHNGKSTVVVDVETYDRANWNLLSSSSFTMFAIAEHTIPSL